MLTYHQTLSRHPYRTVSIVAESQDLTMHSRNLGSECVLLKYKCTRSPWTATSALIKIDGKRQINYLKIKFNSYRCNFPGNPASQKTISSISFHRNHQEKLLFRQKTLTEKNPSLRHKKLNTTHFGKSGFG